jgi:hypothetical protein
LDAVLMALGTGVGGPPSLPAMAGHPRVAHARLIRDDVEVFGDDRGLITLGRGLGGLAELGIEILASHGAGAGRSLIRDSLGLVGEGQPVVASVARGMRVRFGHSSRPASRRSDRCSWFVRRSADQPQPHAPPQQPPPPDGAGAEPPERPVIATVDNSLTVSS